MAIEEKHEYKFTCDGCGKESTMFIPELDRGWCVLTKGDVHIDVDATYVYEDYRKVNRVLRQYRTGKSADIGAVLCPKCASRAYDAVVC